VRAGPGELAVVVRADLDRHAALWGLKRKRLWWALWLLKESDASLRERALDVVSRMWPRRPVL
jgi:hypothetical protein